MIISASRRTDIPAFFGDELISSLRKGEILVPNPMNSRQISKISLQKKDVDCLVFWTKNPEPFIKFLPEIEAMGYKYYFHFTLNPYNNKIEKNLPPKDVLIETFKNLSKRIGSNKIIWRYDPILLSPTITPQYHIDNFNFLAKELHDYTNKCFISFLDVYRKIKKNILIEQIYPPSRKEILYIAKNLGEIAEENNLCLFSCSEETDLSQFNIHHGKCIDDELIKEITGAEIPPTKDKSQREFCGCIKSRDIGIYNTCNHKCIYCYA